MDKTLELAILRDKLAMQKSTIEYWRGQVASSDERIYELEGALESLGLAVYGLFEEMSGDRNLDIGLHEITIRRKYEKARIILNKGKEG